MTTNKPQVKRYDPEGYSKPASVSGTGTHMNEYPQGDYVLATDYEALQAECEQLRKEAARYVPLHEAVQRAAGELPAGWEIQMCVERHAGWVELIGPYGTEDFDTNDERMDYTVIDALEAAIQGSNP